MNYYYLTRENCLPAIPSEPTGEYGKQPQPRHEHKRDNLQNNKHIHFDVKNIETVYFIIIGTKVKLFDRRQG